MSHTKHDAFGLEVARQIAGGLAAHPEWLKLAKSNIERWLKLNSDAPGLVRSYEEWQRLLERPLEEVISELTAQTDRGQRLRQNSPFAGVLTASQLSEIRRRIHEASAA
jgi:hypothetical protein